MAPGLVLERGLSVATNHSDAIEFLTTPDNWRRIIPGAADGVITLEADDGNFVLSAGLTYRFTNTVVNRSGDGGQLHYNVRVQGASSGMPIDFSFHAHYQFRSYSADEPHHGGCSIVRSIDNFRAAGRCSCLVGLITRPALKKALLKENATIVEILGAPPQVGVARLDKKG